jgi:Family of unknown function (DUF6527)
MSHRHGWPYDGTVDGDKPIEPKCVELNADTCIRQAVWRGGGLAGFIEAHDAPDMDVRCEGYLTINLPPNPSEQEASRARWTMTGTLAGGDLTLAPSVRCKRCGHHGFVRDGAWVPA